MLSESAVCGKPGDMALAILSLTAILGHSKGGGSGLGFALNIGDFKSLSQYVRLQLERHNLLAGPGETRSLMI